jgi:hypothetical protein
MADDRSITGSAAAEADVHDDDELAEVLAAELERYSTGTVPVVARAALPREEPMQPLAVPRSEPDGVRMPVVPEPARDEGAFARRAAEVERAMRRASPTPAASREEPSDSFRRSERPSGRRSATGPIIQPTALPTADDLPVKRRTGFRPPPSATLAQRVEPLERVLPTGPVSLPEVTATLLDAMISDATGPVAVVPDHVQARHAAPTVEPVPQTGPIPGLAGHTGSGSADVLYDDWEQSLRAIGRPRAPWEQDDEIVPTGGDPDLATVAITVPGSRPLPEAPARLRADAPTAAEAHPGRRAAHALPEETGEAAGPLEPATRRRRSGRRRADLPADAVTAPAALVAPPTDPDQDPIVHDAPRTDLDFVEAAAFDILPDRSVLDDSVDDDSVGRVDADDEGIDEVAVHYPVVSAATTGAIDLPQVEARPRTAPVFIERVRTALLQLQTVPSSPTGSGAAAVVGRWLGAFASPLTLVLAFGLAAAGSGPAAVVAVLAGALLAVPAVVRTAAWSARVTDDAAMQETAVLGLAAGRPVAVALLVARLGAVATVLLLAGATAGAWADRTGALGLGSSTAALLGCSVVAALGILGAALPVRATAVLTLLAAAVGAVGTLLIALVLTPNGGAPVAQTASGGVAAAVGGFVAVGLVLVLCGSDVARWRTDIAHPVSTAVGAVVAVLCGAVLLGAGTAIASHLTAGGGAVDEFAGALSDASASALAAPMLVILLVSAVTLPALLLRSAGAAAARLLGEGRPVRLGTVAAGLLALAAALGLLASGVDPAGAALAVAALLGVPVAAWAGLLAVTSSARRPAAVGIGLVVATLVGWVLSDGLLPGSTSPVLAALALPASSGLRGGPAIGVAAALLIGVLAGLAGRSAGSARTNPVAGPADTVEG